MWLPQDRPSDVRHGGWCVLPVPYAMVKQRGHTPRSRGPKERKPSPPLRPGHRACCPENHSGRLAPAIVPGQATGGSWEQANHASRRDPHSLLTPTEPRAALGA